MDKITAMITFVSVVKELSFAKAADKLALSPQLVSKYVSQLETSLDTRLLNRTTRRISLTEAGRTYYERVRIILGEIEDMESELNNLQKNAKGTLRINAPVSFAIQHLAKLLTEFQNTYQHIDVELQLSDRKIDIIDEGFDIALRIGNLKSSTLIAKRLAPIKLSICASPAYLDQFGEPTHPEQLVNHKYLRYSYLEEQTVFKNRNTQEAIKVPLTSHFIANNGDVLVEAAIEGAGVIIQPTFITGPAIQAGKLVPILRQFKPEAMSLYAVYGHRKLVSNKIRCFIDFIDQYFGETPYWDRD